MRILLCHRDDHLGDAWHERFAGQDDVSITSEDICRVNCDAIVSPANSFGFMDGGLDLQVSEHFGWDLEKEVQRRIADRPLGELLVGEAMIVPTGDPRVSWLVCAPTMRVPMLVRESVNAYLAMKALLCAALAHRDENPIYTVAVPGLGTGIGRLSPEVAATQMWIAYQEVVLRGGRRPSNFAEAQRQHLALNRTAMIYP